MKIAILKLCLILTAGASATACANIVPGTYSSKTAEALQPGTAAAMEKQASLYAKTNASQQELKRMFVYNGKLYLDTGEISTAKRCGVMDGTIKKTVSSDKIPSKELQSNFGKGYGFQLGTRPNRLEICIDGTWHIFAYHENNMEGVSMKVKRHTAKSAVLTVTNKAGQEVIFGDAFLLERKDAKTGEWRAVPYKNSDFAFDCIAYFAKKDTPASWKVNWSYIYGTLKPGSYRIVKDFRYDKTDSHMESYTLSAKFRIEP